MEHTQMSTKDGAMPVNRKASFGIKLKLLGVLVPTVIVIITVIIFSIYRSTSDIIIRKSEEILSTSTESVVNKVTAWMNETITALDMERDTLEYFSMDKGDELAYIKHTANQYESFPAGIYAATTEGELIHSSFVPGPEYNIFEKPWYIDGIESEEFLFGSVYFDEDSQSYVVGASGVLKDNQGNVRGVAAADIYLDAISDIVKEVKLEQTGAMFLVDANTDMIIGHKDAAMVGTSMAEQENPMYAYAGQLIGSQSYGLQKYNVPGGDTFYLLLAQVPECNWITVAYVPHAEIISDLNALTRKIALISVCGILLLLILIERLIHIIIRPVKKLNKVVGAMSDGDFTIDITVRTKDEIGVMASGVHRFIGVMRGIISHIKQITQLLNSQSVHSTEIAGSLSEASSMQANSMNEMTHTVEELTHSIMEVAESATSLSLLVSETEEQGGRAGNEMEGAVHSSVQGREDMTRLLASMNDIFDKINHLEESSGHMAESIHQINSMVDFIRDIAEETNLLSLNASIEAARAGEAGRGFAIVAGQIGKLAASSKDAVNDISSLTEQIGKLVEQTVQETKDSVTAISNSSGIVNQTEAGFRSIYEAVSRTDESVRSMIDKIQEVSMIATSLAGITQEQSAASEEILATVETMRENAANVSGNSITVADDAKKLQENAARLQEQISLFRIDQ